MGSPLRTSKGQQLIQSGCLLINLLYLWKRDLNEKTMLPRGCLKPVPFKPMWGSKVPKATGNQEKACQLARKATLNKGFIMLGLEKYIQYWQNEMSKCKGFATTFGPYVDYWIHVLLELKEPLPNCGVELLEGFLWEPE